MNNTDSQLSCSWTQFSCPPMKMLAAQLKECKKRLGASPSFWLEMRSGVEAEVSLVWMQGRVIEVRQERDVSLRLTDDTHTFTVFGADRAPKGKPCLEQGKYVMAMGIVLSCNPEPVLRAVKITDLSDNPVHQGMWKFEVDDLHKNIRCT
ncbi:recQ-mediated genome instability protein 2 [Aquarana catesbeiana]|uniref:OB DNA-binding domain-containing protein C16orf175 homolog n=1 Tax=Aquarana catesbeiana TaxID=8400 RepID=C1C3Z5_AQUCT|nr:OB DNA-binding domain-containing protein C16orf175 homolog [Aquarana catesbeiana]